jgi:hypothetical protein
VAITQTDAEAESAIPEGAPPEYQAAVSMEPAPAVAANRRDIETPTAEPGAADPGAAPTVQALAPFPAFDLSSPSTTYVMHVIVCLQQFMPQLTEARRAADGRIAAHPRSQRKAHEPAEWQRLARDEEAIRARSQGFACLMQSWLLNPRYAEPATVEQYAAQVDQASAALIVLSDQRVWGGLAVGVPPLSTLLGALTAHCNVLNKKIEELPAAFRSDAQAKKIREAAERAVNQFDTPLPFIQKLGLKMVAGFVDALVVQKTRTRPWGHQ